MCLSPQPLPFFSMGCSPGFVQLSERGLVRAVVRGVRGVPGGVLLEPNRLSSRSSANPRGIRGIGRGGCLSACQQVLPQLLPSALLRQGGRAPTRRSVLRTELFRVPGFRLLCRFKDYRNPGRGRPWGENVALLGKSLGVDMGEIVRFLFDFPLAQNWLLAKLVELSGCWHRGRRESQVSTGLYERGPAEFEESGRCLGTGLRAVRQTPVLPQSVRSLFGRQS